MIWPFRLAVLTFMLLGAVPAAVAQAPDARPESTGLLYQTSLAVPNSTFGVYDPTAGAWTPLAPYETGAQMAVGAGDLYAFGFTTWTIDRYDAATDTWTPVLPGPPGAGGYWGNLEVTGTGEFLYTESWSSLLWYTSGGTWNTVTLPFVANAMGDYDPNTGQYVVGEYATTNAHLIEVFTWAITDYVSAVPNGEFARFGVAMDGKYWFEVEGGGVHYFDLSNPALPPVSGGVLGVWYPGAAADRANHDIYVTSWYGTDLWVYDASSNRATSLTGGFYGTGSSLAFTGSEPPDDRFAHVSRVKINQRPAALPGTHKVVCLGIVHDEFHAPLPGITVEGAWTYPDNSVHPGVPAGPTNSAGQFKFRIKEPICGLFRFDVTNLSGPGFVYDWTANHTPPHVEIEVPCP